MNQEQLDWVLRAEEAGALNAEQKDWLARGREAGAIPPRDMGWGQALSRATETFVPSLTQVAKDTVYPFMNPVETAKTMGQLGLGIMQKLIPGRQEYEGQAEAVGQFFADRYGGIENVKKTLAEDPAGMLTDLGTVLTGGAGLAAKAPMLAGRTAQTVGRVGRAIDPVSVATEAAGMTARGLGEVGAGVAGLTSGVGRDVVRQAARAGYLGGALDDVFTAHLRGRASPTEALDAARSALEQIRQDRGAAYRSGMANISRDATVLDFNEILDSYSKAVNENTFQGVPRSEGAARALKNIESELVDWMDRDPAVFHTPEGLDALKQRIGDLVDWNNKAAKENQAILSMYDDIKSVIREQAPAYADVMKGYEEASNTISEIQKALSLNDKASVDTQMRKLQSVMRDNVNTNYGQRAESLAKLEEATGQEIAPMLAGQAASSLTPRGLQGLTGSLTALGGFVDPTILLGLPFQSPRAVAEGARAAGMAARGAPILMRRGLPQASFQTGRMAGELAPPMLMEEPGDLINYEGASLMGPLRTR